MTNATLPSSIRRTLLLPITLLLSISLTLTSAWEKRIDAHGKTIIAYYASWQWYDRGGLAKPSNLDHSKVTRYNFAFFQINEQGDIWGTDSWADPIVLYGEFDWSAVPGQGKEYCSWDHADGPPACAGHHYNTGLIYQAHAAGVEVYPSIGGWTLSDPFPALAAHEGYRKKFAENCVKLIETYDFDGIDIDWEYPGYVDHSGTPEDTVNYSLFLQAIRDALDELGQKNGRFYGLTAALPCGPDLIDNIIIDEVKDILTEFNLMTYDFHGSWNTNTGANAPLYDMDGSPEFSVHACVENWKKGGAGNDQINIGLPFYGRSFAGSGLTGFGQPFGGYADMVTWSDDEGSPQYFNIVDKKAQFTTVRDTQTMTEFMYNSAGLVSYDDERAICDKTEYAMEHNLNGYIIWEISGDLLQDLSTPLLDACNDKLNNPTMPCAPGEELLMDTVIDGDVWYPSQTLGYCLNDGKQSETYLTSDQMFASVKACCVASFEYDDNCIDTSLNPGSNGQWVAVGDLADINPWYPNQSLGFCVNDGKQDQLYVSSDFLFTSADFCCDSAYSFSLKCLASSLGSDSDAGHLVAMDVEIVENPWYPHPVLGYCVQDGTQKQYFISAESLFTSAEACCDGVYYTSSATCLSSSLNPGSNGVYVEGVDEGDPWYPQPSIGACIADGKHKKDSIASHHLFNSVNACCDAIYSFNPDCVIKSLNPKNVGKWYQNGNHCSSESPVPSWVDRVYNSEEECCNEHFGLHYASCVHYNPDDIEYIKDQFYPHYGENGSSAECRNDGNAPDWQTGSMLRHSRHECCHDFFFPSWSEECNEQHPYYPDFHTKTCVNDGNQPAFMTGDYLADSLWLCCHNFFLHDEEQLQICTATRHTASDTPVIDSTTSVPEPEIQLTSQVSDPAVVVPDASIASDSSSAQTVFSVLEDKKVEIDNNILLYQTPAMDWVPSSIYRYKDLVAALTVMHNEGVANKYFFLGDDSSNGHVYGLVNIAAFLAQSMKETIKYNACDENSWDLVAGGYPLSNACGQLGQSYQDYSCAEHEKHMECPVKKDMAITATTNAKWWGAPAPLKCGPTELYPFTGYWDYKAGCDDCDDYDGQKGGAEVDSSSPNSNGRTDVEGCCWWGRGVIQTTGVCNFGKLNWYLGAGAVEDGREARYPDVNFCETPDAVCSSEEHKELKWIAGLFYWVESLQTYNVGGWNYIDELKKFVDNGLQGSAFIDSVSGIVNRGCHNPPCASGGVDGMWERSSNFVKVLTEFDLV